MGNDVTKKLGKLNLMDRFLFDSTMENRDAYQAMVSILLEREVELLTKPEVEKEIRISPILRQVRLDVVSMDKQHVIYHTEMQQQNTRNLIRRSRYYQAQMDVSLLEPGDIDFNLLNDTCFILVAPFDLFGKGLYRYTFEGVCRECPELTLDDGAVRVFINTAGTNREDFSEEFLALMKYLSSTTDEVAASAGSEKITQIHNRVRQIKLSERMGGKYMLRWEELEYARRDGVEEGIEQGIEQGIEKGRIAGLAEGRASGIEEGRNAGLIEGIDKLLIKQVCRKLKKNKSLEEIAEELEEDTDRIRKYYDTAVKYAPEYDFDEIYQELKQAENGAD